MNDNNKETNRKERAKEYFKKALNVLKKVISIIVSVLVIFAATRCSSPTSTNSTYHSYVISNVLYRTSTLSISSVSSDTATEVFHYQIIEKDLTLDEVNMLDINTANLISDNEFYLLPVLGASEYVYAIVTDVVNSTTISVTYNAYIYMTDYLDTLEGLSLGTIVQDGTSYHFYPEYDNIYVNFPVLFSNSNLQNAQVDIINRLLILCDNAPDYESGYQAGYQAGLDENVDEAYGRGLTDGYENGRADGYDTGYSQGYDSGQIDGYASGFEIGNDSGYRAGYADGYSVGEISGGQINNPVVYFLQPVVGFLNTPLFGSFSIGTVISVFLFAAVAIMFVRLFAGG